MFEWNSSKEWRRLLRYYMTGLLNTVFGFGVYAVFVRLGMNIFIAQILSHLVGMAFNYLTYSRYAFAGHSEKISNYILSYAVIYLFNLASLAFLTQFVRSAYMAGLIATIFVSIVNYFILRRYVFTEPAS